MKGRSRVRLIFAIVSTILEEIALVAIVLWGLPKLGINIPLWGLAILMVGWGAYAVYTYRQGSRALLRKPVTGLTGMIGSRGMVVNALAPEGFVRVEGELWRAISIEKSIEVGEEITVIGQDGLRLIVRKSSTGDSVNST